MLTALRAGGTLNEYHSIFNYSFVACFNCIVSEAMTTKEMQTKFVDGQNVVGKIATNIFYAPAWFLKLLKITIIKTVK